MPAYQAVVFDLDDTLLDDAQATRLGVQALFEHYAPARAAEAGQHWQAALSRYYTDFLDGQLSAAQMRQARIRHALASPELSDQQAEQAFEYFMQAYVAACADCLFDDALPCLSELQQRGYVLALVSNGPDAMQLRKVAACQLEPFMAFTLTAEAAGVAKPKPEIFQQAGERLGLEAKECLYVGDNLEKDARAAKQAGWDSVWLNRKGHQSPADVVSVGSLGELLTQVLG